uniref:Uncharacterized protein n=1 Tax=Anguilla anguilla TaxID=7936 RepID=A0A0E9PQP6_ANGAN
MCQPNLPRSLYLYNAK